MTKTVGIERLVLWAEEAQLCCALSYVVVELNCVEELRADCDVLTLFVIAS